MTQGLGWDGSNTRVSVLFYKAVVQAVLLYGLEKWFLTPWMVRTLGAFHHRVDYWITGRQLWRGVDMGWFYPNTEEAMKEVDLENIENFIDFRQKKIAQNIMTHPILELCLSAEWRPGALVTNQWWEQGGLDWEENWEAVRAEYAEGKDTEEAEEDG